MNALKTILAPFASLRLTIVLLVLCMILVLAGTTAQREMGIQDVQKQFFHSWIAKVDFHDFQSTPPTKPGEAPGAGYIPGHFFMPGGYLLIAVMLVNLLAAHTVRFKLRAKRIGIILIHSGLILLLVGELLTSLVAVESQMRIDVGASTNFSEDIRFPELAIVDRSSPDHDHVAVIAASRLEAAAGGAPIRDPNLPFDIKVDRWYENSTLRGPMQKEPQVDRLATEGAAKSIGIVAEKRVGGVGGDAERTNIPSAFITLFSKSGTSLGTYLVSLYFDRSFADLGAFRSQPVVVDGKTYTLDLRFTRYYKPYTITLKKFTHEIIPGTDLPRDFASTIQLVDPANHVDREVRIWMNHPLRFDSETFYQQSFANNDRTTVLQVVDNKASTLPYIACVIGGLGLILHFGITLVSFLRRRLAPTPGTVGAIGASSYSSRGDSRTNSGGDADRYVLKPEPRWKTAGIPLAVLFFSLIWVISQFFVAPPTRPYDFDALGHVPIFIEGRTQPLDSAARNFLAIVSGGKYREAYRDELGKMHPAVEWMIDVMTLSNDWANDKVIRIDHPQIKDMLGLKEEEKLFSWKDIGLDKAEVAEKLDTQSRLANETPEKDRDSLKHQILDLHQHLGIFRRLMQIDAIAYQLDLMKHPERARQNFDAINRAVMAADPQLIDDIKANKIKDPDRAFGMALAKLDRSTLTADQRDSLEKPVLLGSLQRMGQEGDLFLIPPAHPGEQWKPLMSVLDSPDNVPDAPAAILKIFKDYADARPTEFNSDLTGYLARVSTLPDISTVNYEVGFNRFNPFYVCIVFYVGIAILAFCSWLFWTKPLWRSGYALMILTLVIHTAGIVSRIYISGRPPVTNLYSAAVFIGWGIVLFSSVLEAIFRNGIGLVAGSTAGFMSLLVAAGFAAGEGDTMRQLQAVLDTNYWLATHVVCVTLGYMATVLAGVLAMIYVLRGLFDRSFAGEPSKDNVRMIYGIVCFAMLFSFVGTILGGIWADQSWGRFWGWDPKENGAVLVVLWNALILHARWSGTVRDRGVAVLAILGNIVVGWSYVGTNLMGIGLHSYGFMSGAQLALYSWVFFNLALAAIGLIPRKFWAIASVDGK
ncbi:MAG TPA: cytochrome c biogenesis protein CcsA [Tepidisphaeraceae bacterium]|nr:cytochrome c biogenesis protein CcsA [Tepidisphaeraceae bacterium]